MPSSNNASPKAKANFVEALRKLIPDQALTCRSANYGLQARQRRVVFY